MERPTDALGIILGPVEWNLGIPNSIGFGKTYVYRSYTASNSDANDGVMIELVA